MKQIYRFVYSLLLLIMLVGCPGGSPSDELILNVPHCQQTKINYCAVASILMWRQYDGLLPDLTQDQIGGLINVGELGTSPASVVAGVCVLTNSDNAEMVAIHDYLPGAQGDLVSACIEGVDNYVPSIMPFYYGFHAVVFVGYKGRTLKEDGSPLAKYVYINDPETIYAKERITFADLKDFYFTPVDFDYYVILGDPSFFTYGTIGHDQFVWNLGTYYGGPSVYDPKGILDIDPSETN
jgi:hypothetical protein